jgi:RimJ/RimL family protein N-acetyltransferase
MPVPDSLRTARLLLRRWRPEDAVLLQPVLAANVAHLQPWIPWHVAEPLPEDQLATRLASFAADFDAGRQWVYAILAADGGAVYGGVGLYPRAGAGRVPYDAADHVEIGYWLRTDVTGQGYATEAAGAVLALAEALPRMTRVEIRCDARNTRSAAVPQRLGFRHTRTVGTVGTVGSAEEPPPTLMIWERACPTDRTADRATRAAARLVTEHHGA